MVNFYGASEKFSVFDISQNIDGLISDKTIHKAVRIHKTLSTKPIRDFFMFTKYSLKIYA